MRALIVSAALAVALPGCAQQRIEQGLNAQIGQPAPALFARLGYPDGRTMVGGQRAYVWGSESPGSGYLSSGHASRPGTGMMTLATSTMTMVPADYVCRITVIVNSADRVLSWDSRGNEGGCAPYARRLAR